jgi:hypothetical protein
MCLHIPIVSLMLRGMIGLETGLYLCFYCAVAYADPGPKSAQTTSLLPVSVYAARFSQHSYSICLPRSDDSRFGWLWRRCVRSCVN